MEAKNIEKTGRKGWQRNTALCVNLKTVLRGDGSLRLNFKPMRVGSGFSVERYALGVYNEICMALGGLVEEG